MPPPIAPAESICIIMKPGKTSAIPASASVPRRETHHVSIRPVDACAVITRMFGHAIMSSVGTIAPCSRRRVRGFIVSAAGAGAVARAAESAIGTSAARVLTGRWPWRADVPASA